MKAAVTGANGFVGSFLCEHLVQEGHDVTAIVRPTSDLRWIEKLKINKAYADLSEPDKLLNAVDGANVVYHCAAIVKADSRRDFMNVNFRGMKNLAQACLKAKYKPKRFVFISSQAAAGPSPGPEGIDEDYPSKPVSAYGESKLAAERYLSETGGLETVIVRPSAVFGPRDRETFNFFKIVAKLRVRPLLGGGKTLVSMIDVRDLVRGIALAGETPSAAGGTYFLANPVPFSIREVMTTVASAFGKSTIGLPVPKLLMSAGAEVSQFLAQFGKGKAELSHLKVAELSQKYWVVKTGRAQKELGFKPLRTTTEGLGDAAMWYLDNGWL